MQLVEDHVPARYRVEMKDLVSQVAKGRVSRRSFFMRTGSVGIGAATASTVLAASGGGGGKANGAQTGCRKTLRTSGSPLPGGQITPGTSAQRLTTPHMPPNSEGQSCAGVCDSLQSTSTATSAVGGGGSGGPIADKFKGKTIGVPVYESPVARHHCLGAPRKRHHRVGHLDGVYRHDAWSLKAYSHHQEDPRRCC